MGEGIVAGIFEGRGVSFNLPSPPPSVNSLYYVLFSLRKTELKPEVRKYKSQMKVYVPPFEVRHDEKVCMAFNISANWFHKNGKIRKVDVQNMVKVLVDLITEKQGWDDSNVWEVKLSKSEAIDNKECVEVCEWIKEETA